MKKPILGWWFAESDTLPNRDGRKVVIGETLSVDGEIKCCKKGLHSSRRLLDALEYATGPLIYRVSSSGVIDEQKDKIAASHRKHLWVVDGTKLLRIFAATVAREALESERRAGREPHKDSWHAVEVALRYANGEATDQELGAAGSAAGRAAWDAARSAAWNAAWDAAGSAAGNAAWDAAGRAAWDAAGNAARKRQNTLLTRLVMAEHRRLSK